MKLKSIRVQNYKCFEDSGPVSLGDRMTCVVGRNNTGKTAFLESLALKLPERPHRNPKYPKGATGASPAIVDFDVIVSGREIEEFCLEQNVPLSVPVEFSAGAIQNVFKSLLEKDAVKFSLNTTTHSNWVSTISPSHGLFQAFGSLSFASATLSGNKDFSVSAVRAQHESLPEVVGSIAQRSTYIFKAQRLNISDATNLATMKLSPDASNLPSALNYLKSVSPAKFDEFVAHATRILPDIKSIYTVPVNKTNIEIRVSPLTYKEDRIDIATPLSENGTGVGQVLALLHVLVASENPTTIAIDEPSSFLHPGAVRELLRTFKIYNKHQYVIATHAPEVVSLCDPDSVILFEKEETKSKASTMTFAQAENVRSVLDNLGVRLTDFFGAQGVVWVEGATERACFPEIARAFGVTLPNGVVFSSIVNVGSLTSKKPMYEQLWDIYMELTNANALLPNLVAFSLDRENRSDEDCRKLEARSRGRLRFLPRRMYENYILNPSAIAFVISQHKVVSTEIVERWLSAVSRRSKYFDARISIPTYPSEDWTRLVDGAEVLKDAFWELSDETLEYRKVTHGKILTSKIIENNRDDLLEIGNYIESLLQTP